MEKAALKATSSLSERGPENAVLYGKFVLIYKLYYNIYRMIPITCIVCKSII